MAQDLGSIYTSFRLALDKLEGDINKAQAELRKGHAGMEKLQQESMDKMAKSTQSLSEGFKTVGTTVTAAGAGIAVGLGYCVKVAADFEKELSNTKAVSGATAGEMEKLKQAALEMGAATSFSASEAAQAITELAKGGMSTADILSGGLKAALDLAAAGELSMGEAAEYVIKSMTPFNMKASEAGKIADLLAGAANASATDVREMGQALSQSAAVASQMGLNLADTTTTLALFANKGLVGADAGTSLKTMLMRLIPSSKEATVAMGELGLITEDGKNKFFDASGNIRSMSEIAGLLKGSLQGLTAEQKQMALQTMFGSDAIRAGSFIAEAGAEGFDKMAASIGKVSAADVAGEKLNNLQGAIESLKGSVETVMITIGDTFLPILQKLANYLVKVVNVFNSLPAPIQKAIAVFAVLVAGIALVAGPVLLLLGYIPSIIAGFAMISTVVGGVGPVFAALTGPIGLVIAAIASFAAIAIVVIKNWTPIKKFFTDLWNGIKDTFTTVLNAIKSFIENIWNGIKTVTVTIWNAIKAAITTPIENVKSFLSTAWNTIKTNIETIWNGLKTSAVNIWNAIKTAITTPIENVKSFLSTAWNTIKTTAINAWDTLKSAAGRIFNQIKEAIISPFKNIHIPMPHFDFSVIYKTLAGIKFPVPKVDVDWYAKGGIFTSPQIIGVGEAGPEAVIPLNKTNGIGGVTINMYGPVNVRDDQDILRISRELFSLQQQASRAKGALLSV